MKTDAKRLIFRLLASNDVMSLATVRPAGYPQATTLAYANDGLRLYFACDRACQKIRNARSRKVSLTTCRESRIGAECAEGGVHHVVEENLLPSGLLARVSDRDGAGR